MTPATQVDVVCVGRVFLDVAITGLTALPRPGEEAFGSGASILPGGMANVAVGLRQLGHTVRLVSNRGRDRANALAAEAIERAGITWVGPTIRNTPLTVVLSTPDDRTMATHRVTSGDPSLSRALQGITCRAAVAMLGPVQPKRSLPPVYLLNSARTARDWRGGLPSGLNLVRALLASEAEALMLTGKSDPISAARALAAHGPAAVVTLGRRGALAVDGDVLHEVEAPPVEARDVTAAGNLFAAAYVWADLAGMDQLARLRAATTYASLSTTRESGFHSAPTLAMLVRAMGRAHQDRDAQAASSTRWSVGSTATARTTKPTTSRRQADGRPRRHQSPSQPSDVEMPKEAR